MMIMMMILILIMLVIDSAVQRLLKSTAPSKTRRLSKKNQLLPRIKLMATLNLKPKPNPKSNPKPHPFRYHMSYHSSLFPTQMNN